MTIDNAISLIRLNQASLVYGDTVVLDKLSWQVKAGEHWAVVGHNGAGKTSLLRLLRGEARPHVNYSRKAAENFMPPITWNFEGSDDASPLAVRPFCSLLSPDLQRHYIRQGWRLTGEDVILSGFGEGYMLYDAPSQEEKEAVYALASRLGATHLLDALAPDLSQGQLRLLLMARALVKQPRLLLLDEPCDGLDAATQKNIFGILDEVAAQNTTIICAIHRGEDIPACLTHMLELEKGRITRQGAMDAGIFRMQRKPDATRRQKALPISGPKGKNVFSMKNADVYLKRKRILHKINWDVSEGEQWLLSGPNGSGKTTLLRVLLGEEHVALGGSLKWFGLEHHVTLEERQKYTGYVSDWLRNNYSYDLTGRELVLSGLHNTVGLYRESTKDELREADYWLERMGLTHMAERPLEKMSEGISRRFLLARAMAPRPKLLILDEPCSGLDGESRERFMQYMPLLAEHGAQIIFVSHSKSDLAGIYPLLTHELALKDGEVEYMGTVR